MFKHSTLFKIIIWKSSPGPIISECMLLDIRAFVNNYREFSVSPPAIIQASSSCNSITLTILLQIPYWHFSAMLRAKYALISKMDCLHVLSLFLVLSPSYSCSSPTPPQLFPAPSILSHLSFQKRSEIRRGGGGGWASLAKIPQLAEIIYPNFGLYTYLLLSMGIMSQDPQWMPLPGWDPPDRSRASNYYSVQPLYRSTPLSSVFVIGMFSLHGGPRQLAYC